MGKPPRSCLMPQLTAPIMRPPMVRPLLLYQNLRGKQVPDRHAEHFDESRANCSFAGKRKDSGVVEKASAGNAAGTQSLFPESAVNIQDRGKAVNTEDRGSLVCC